VKSIRQDVLFVADNCYGEFAEESEPPMLGADLTAGSLIKNPGGGIASSGGYIAGTARAVELAAYRLTAPFLGAGMGAMARQTADMLKGLFLAPHAVCQSIKTAMLAAFVFGRLGFEVLPGPLDERSDIIQAIKFGDAEKMSAFVRGIQAGSAVDSHAVPEPSDMPGYGDRVIMASGSFTQGSSIEISADGPMRPPFAAFLQGGLTYEHGKLCIIKAIESGGFLK